MAEKEKGTSQPEGETPNEWWHQPSTRANHVALITPCPEDGNLTPFQLHTRDPEDVAGKNAQKFAVEEMAPGSEWERQIRFSCD